MIEETFKIYLNKVNVLLIIENTDFVITDKPKNYRYEGCFNKETHDFDGGELKDMDELIKDALNNPMLEGITFSGGDPLEQAEEFSYMAKSFKEAGLNIWCYTGYTFEKVLESVQKNKHLRELINNIDILVDGRFEIENKKEGLRFKGSSNQRIIDVKKSLDSSRITVLE